MNSPGIRSNHGSGSIKKLKRTNAADFMFNAVNIILLSLFTIVCFYPFYLLFINSLSSPEYIMNGVFFIPKNITVFNYKTVFANEAIVSSILISASRTVLGTALTVVCSCFLGFLFTKKNMLCRKLIYRMMVFSMYIGSGIIPYYIVMNAYGFTNNYLVYIVPSAVNAFYVILFKTYIESIPASFEESASIDGAGILTIYFNIILPLSLPIIASIAVFSAVSQWNAWFDNFLLCTSSSLKTLQLMLYDILNKSTVQIQDAMSESAASVADRARRTSPVSVRVTMTMVTMIPIMAVYPFLQRYFVKGLMLGAIKG